MGISENELQEERQSQPIAGYTAWLKFHAITDDVFSNYVRMIPCLYVSIPKTIARWEGSTLMWIGVESDCEEVAEVWKWYSYLSITRWTCLVNAITGIENTLFHIHWFATSIKDSSAVKLSSLSPLDSSGPHSPGANINNISIPRNQPLYIREPSEQGEMECSIQAGVFVRDWVFWGGS